MGVGDVKIKRAWLGCQLGRSKIYCTAPRPKHVSRPFPIPEHYGVQACFLRVLERQPVHHLPLRPLPQTGDLFAIRFQRYEYTLGEYVTSRRCSSKISSVSNSPTCQGVHKTLGKRTFYEFVTMAERCESVSELNETSVSSCRNLRLGPRIKS